MLMLSRKPGEAVQIGDDIVVRVVKTSRGQCKLLFEAPKEVPIMRKELLQQRSALSDDWSDEEDTGFSISMLGI